MLNSRHIAISLAISFSLSVHMAVLYSTHNPLSRLETDSSPTYVIPRLSFRFIMPETPTPQVATPPAKPIPRQAEKKPPPPKIIRKSTPERARHTQATTHTPAPVPAKKQTADTHRTETTEASPVKKENQASHHNPAIISASLQKKYLAQLISRIESNKFYPLAARRRGIEGAVDISFALANAGQMRNLKVDGGHRLLRMAVEKLMRATAPFPTPPEGVRLPMQIHYRMSFQLDPSS